jgi:TolB-like protein
MAAIDFLQVVKMLKRSMMMGVILVLASAGGAFSGTVNKEYSLDYPHEVTRDYVYRTPRVYQPESSGSSSWFKLSSTKENKTLIHAEEGTELGLRVRELVAELLATSREPVVGELQVAVATFVHLDHLYETSAMGRYISERMIHELQRAGVDVVEMRMMPSMKISESHGEYVLSRDMGELSYVHEVDAVVAGTYTIAADQIFLNGRLLGVEDGKVLAVASTVFEIDPIVAALLSRSGQPVPPPATVSIQSYQDIAQ